MLTLQQNLKILTKYVWIKSQEAARFRVCGVAFPAISKHPKAFLYGWLPLSDAFGIFLADRYLYSAQRHLLCDCASTILFLLLYSFVNVYYLSLVSAKNAEGMKRIQAGGEVRSTEPLLRVRKQISSEGTTEFLSPLWGSFHSCLPYRGSVSLHRLSVVLLPFGDYAVVNRPSGFYSLLPVLQGFRFASPPACSLAPLWGLLNCEQSFRNYSTVNSHSGITQQ